MTPEEILRTRIYEPEQLARMADAGWPHLDRGGATVARATIFMALVWLAVILVVAR